MKTFELAEAFRGIVEAAGFPEVTLRVGSWEEEPSFPMVTFNASARPIGGSDSILHFELTVSVQSQAEDSQASAHAELANEVRAFFLGATEDQRATRRQAVKDAIAAAGVFELLGRGLSVPSESQSPEDGATIFKTPFRFAGTARVL